jgi:hypothetical protein
MILSESGIEELKCIILEPNTSYTEDVLSKSELIFRTTYHIIFFKYTFPMKLAQVVMLLALCSELNGLNLVGLEAITSPI